MATSRRSFLKHSAAVVSGSALLRAQDAPANASLQDWSSTNRFGIALAVKPTKGTYTLLYHGSAWFGAGLVSVLYKNRWYRSADLKLPTCPPSASNLQLKHSNSGSATDHFGAYDFLTLLWSVPDTPVQFQTGFRVYQDQPYLIFEQHFPNGFENYANGDWTVPSAAFPEFLTGFDEPNDLNTWVSGGMFTQRFGYGNAVSLDGTVDLLVTSDKSHRTLLLSPFANYLVATQQGRSVPSQDEVNPSKSTLSCGIEGLVERIPPGFHHEHILVAGAGIHSAFLTWGDTLLKKSGKARPSKYLGDNLKYPVYWDDYGAYYQTHGFKQDGYASYEDIILAVNQDARAHGLRIGSYQVQDEDQLHDLEGVFEPKQRLFPHGLAWLREQLRVPLEAYYCWLAPGGPYRKQYAYFATASGRTPGRSMGDVFYSLDYWRYTAKKVSDWGDISFQHDFLSTYEGDKVMMADLNRMNDYFNHMATALREKNVTIQYCMQLPRNILQSTENPTMLAVQGSWDHHVQPAEPSAKQTDDDPFVWKHLIFTSAFYGAVGIWPCRDNIQTMADPNAYEDVLLANLLGGEIQLGHKIGECNFELVKRTYREGDCLILKPTRPIAPIDRCYTEGGVVGYTESESDGKSWYYVLSLPDAGYLPYFTPADLGGSGTYLAFNFEAKTASVLDCTAKIHLEREAKHEYFVIAPLLENGMAVIGDTTKFVSMADQRIAHARVSGETLQVGVISNAEQNPIITGYSQERPASVVSESAALEPVSSLDMLRIQNHGWFWDHQTSLWHVKVDFSGASQMGARVFEIQPAGRA